MSCAKAWVETARLARTFLIVHPTQGEKTMKTIERAVTLQTSASNAWIALREFGDIDRFNPNLKESHLLEGSPATGIGARRHCTMSDGKNYIREEVIDWREGQGYTVDIFEGTMPLRTAQATLRIEPSGASACEVSMSLTYEPKFGALGAVLDVVMLRRMLLGSCAKVLEGLRSHLGEMAA